MPDPEGKQSGPGTSTPDQAYKDHRPEDMEEGSLGAETGGPGTQKSRLPEGSGEEGSYQAGGFGGQEADDTPDRGVPAAATGEGDPSPHAQYDQAQTEDAGETLELGEDDAKGSATTAPGSLGNVDDPSEVGHRGYGQQPDYDAADPSERQAHPANPSDMGNR